MRQRAKRIMAYGSLLYWKWTNIEYSASDDQDVRIYVDKNLLFLSSKIYFYLFFISIDFYVLLIFSVTGGDCNTAKVSD